MATQAHKQTHRRSVGEGLDDQFLGNIYNATVVRRLLGYVWPYKLWGVLSLVGMGGYIATMVAQPLIIAWGIDGFITAPDTAERWGSLQTVALVFLANSVGTLVFQFIQLRSMARLSTQLLFDLRRSMFNHLQRQSTTFFDRNEVGRIMSRVQNDTLALQEFLEVGVMTIGDMLMLVFIAATLFFLNPVLAAVTFSLTPLLLLTLVLWQRWAQAHLHPHPRGHLRRQRQPPREHHGGARSPKHEPPSPEPGAFR